MAATESSDAGAWLLLVGGTLVFVLALIRRWRQINLPPEWLPDVVRVVDKRRRTESSEDGDTDYWFLVCTRDENGEPVSGEILVEVSHEAWINSEINREIKVYHKDGDLGDVRPAAGTPASHMYRAMLFGALLILIGGLLVLRHTSG